MLRLCRCLIPILLAFPLCGWEHPKTDGSSPSAKEIAEVEFGLKEPPQSFQGAITETIQTENYSYLKLQSLDGKDSIWIATNRVNFDKGTRMRFTKPQPMVNFYSKTLDRNFPEIYFLADFEVAKADTKGKDKS